MTDILPISFAVALVLIMIDKIRAKLGKINLRKTIQTLHTKSISRFGGFAIFISLFIVAWFSNIQEYSFLLITLLCLSPIFLLGIIDDLEYEINPIYRLAIVFPSVYLLYYFLGIEAYSVDIWLIDWLFSYQFFSILFICFAISGIVNAFNMIDGINGLVLLYSLSICASVVFSLYAITTLEVTLYFTALFFSILGVFLLNFPLGKIFIGDGGAYFLGAAISVGLIKVYQINDLSPWYVFLKLIYPITDVGASFLRRMLENQSPLAAFQPDDRHLHHILLSRINKLGIKSHNTKHTLVTILLFCFYTPFLVAANYFALDTGILISLSIIFIVFYFCLYFVLSPKSFKRFL